MLRIVFMGSDAIALPALNWLVTEARGLAEVDAERLPRNIRLSVAPRPRVRLPVLRHRPS